MNLAALLRPGLVLGVFTLAAAALLALTHEATREPIARAERQALLRSLSALIPPGSHDNELLEDTVLLPPAPLLGTGGATRAYRARLAGRVIAVAFTAVAPDGYNGAIRLLLAVAPDGRLLGVRVINHRETPGLGDGIEADRSPWILRFAGKSLGQPPPEQWRVIKDGGAFDQMTGATITPRAVVAAVRRALEYFRNHRATLLAPAPPAGPPAGGESP